MISRPRSRTPVTGSVSAVTVAASTVTGLVVLAPGGMSVFPLTFVTTIGSDVAPARQVKVTLSGPISTRTFVWSKEYPTSPPTEVQVTAPTANVADAGSA